MASAGLRRSTPEPLKRTFPQRLPKCMAKSSTRSVAQSGKTPPGTLPCGTKSERCSIRSSRRTPPTPQHRTELAAYYAKLFIDVQRQADDLLDITPFIANIIKAEDAQEVSYVRNWLPFVGKEEVISGTNDKVPLMDAAAADRTDRAEDSCIRLERPASSTWPLHRFPFSSA